MKVKTFIGIRGATVDKQVTDWLAKSNVTVHKTNVAFKGLRERGPDAIAGRTAARRALAIAISIWYDEKPKLQSRTDTWRFGSKPPSFTRKQGGPNKRLRRFPGPNRN